MLGSYFTYPPSAGPLFALLTSTSLHVWQVSEAGNHPNLEKKQRSQSEKAILGATL